MEQTRANSDWLWQAAATEGLCCAVAVLSDADSQDFGPLPSLAAFIGNANDAVTTSTVQLRNFMKNIPQYYGELLLLYEKAKVWPLLYIEACLKMARLVAQTAQIQQVSEWTSRGWAYISSSSLPPFQQVTTGTNCRCNWPW